MISKWQMLLATCAGLPLAACGAGSGESSSDPKVEAPVAEALARPTEVRAVPASNLTAIGRPILARPELRKVPTHDVDVTEIAAPTRAIPLTADTQEGSISLSTGKWTTPAAPGAAK